jgi:hypothetical protein
VRSPFPYEISLVAISVGVEAAIARAVIRPAIRIAAPAITVIVIAVIEERRDEEPVMMVAMAEETASGEAVVREPMPAEVTEMTATEVAAAEMATSIMTPAASVEVVSASAAIAAVAANQKKRRVRSWSGLGGG